MSTTSGTADLESEDFDPLIALTLDEHEITLPVPGAKIYNNLDEYFKKSLGGKPFSSSTHSQPKTTTIRKFTADQFTPNTSRNKNLPSVLTKMKEYVGPMSLLTKSVNQRVKVYIRRRRRVEEGTDQYFWLTALLIAFDKHCNLVLYDVDERQDNKKEGQRYFKKLFVRGDNVILVSSA